jgi:hypothetical protein
MPKQAAHALAVQPVVAYPRRAQSGKKYLMTIDLRWDCSACPWPYPDEEYPIYCMVEAFPLFVIQPLGVPAVVLHRFGGTYGPAQFVLTAADEPMEGTIRIELITASGKTVRILRLRDISITREEPPDEEHLDLPWRGGAPPPSRCPFRGLAPYREEDADAFFGRDEEVEMLLKFVATNRGTLLVGDPWAGKSSLLHAGLAARVRRDGLAGRRYWQIASFRPGAQPIRSLLAALPPSEWGTPDDRRRLELDVALELLRYKFPSNFRPLLVLVDQFEEIFFECRDAHERERFVENLLAAVEQDDSRIMIAVSGQYQRTVDDLLWRGRKGWVLVPTLVSPHTSRIADIVAQTAANFGYRLEGPSGKVGEGFAEQPVRNLIRDDATRIMTAAATDSPAPSPEAPPILGLVQLALVGLWRFAEARGSQEFTRDDYRRLGGLEGAAADYAESV